MKTRFSLKTGGAKNRECSEVETAHCGSQQRGNVHHKSEEMEMRKCLSSTRREIRAKPEGDGVNFPRVECETAKQQSIYDQDEENSRQAQYILLAKKKLPEIVLLYKQQKTAHCK